MKLSPSRELLEGLPTRLEVRDFLVGVLTGNLGFKALSLFVALGIWAYVQGERVVVDVARVKVNYELHESLAFVRQPQKVLKLSLSGPQGKVREAMRRQLTLDVDLSELTPGDPIVEFSADHIQGIPPELTVLNLVPNSVQVELENKITRRVELELMSLTRVAEGYRMVDITLDPPSVEIRGPASVVESRERIGIQPLDISDMTRSGRLPVTLNLPPVLELVTEGPFYAELTVERVTTTRQFEGVPVTMRNPDWEAALRTIEVTLDGPQDVLEGMSAEEDITALVHVPRDTPARQITVRLDESKAARVSISHTGGDEVTVVSIEPDSFTVEPRAREPEEER